MNPERTMSQKQKQDDRVPDVEVTHHDRLGLNEDGGGAKGYLRHEGG